MDGAELRPDGQKVAKVARREGGEVDASMLLLRGSSNNKQEDFYEYLVLGGRVRNTLTLDEKKERRNKKSR